ncbi:carbohydrate-binding protein [Fibrobacter sp. UWB12]|uniref:carbohydrate-binding protein n=1 Tax=Fibrobacter sp. UWB12 TaxID=1896203 RepID=UPI00091A3C15|nr:carbohydrate-binding protein [Fibrobacter sp. UWB12]SHK49355.1 Carbohydrate binding module (family 6) [Fibrobacter sp. UWB12]
MRLLKSVTVFGMLAGFGVSALADNPISAYHYLADPGAAADDTYFYVITDSDDPAASNANGYNIKALYGFRTKDMKNWTDFGIIYDARKVDGIGDIWASGIAVNPNDGRLYIVFPDGGGGGVGLIGADSIAGPWTNPVSGNKKLINNWGGGLADCDGIGWCFDPAIFFDDDGQGYFTFGGGESNSRPAANNNNNIFNIYKFNKDMKGFDVSSKTQLKIGGPKAMEASYIHKYKDNYYLSYSTADLRIAYGMSKNPMGPYEYKGIFMGNPNIGGQNINANNNNHHGIAEFKGHWYVAYHDRRIANGYDGLEKIPADDGRPNPVPAFHRSVSVDEFTYNADGTMKELTFTKEGPKQIENFDPYDWYPALTSSKQKGIRSRSNWAPGKVAEHLLLPLSTKESWIRVSGVDFGTAATSLTVQAASTDDGNKIEIRMGSATGTLAGTCTLKNTGSKNSFADNSCEVEGLKGIVEQLFFVFKGSKDSTMAIKAWGFEGSGTTPPEPQKPYGEKAVTLPAKIEAEHYDIPGVGRGGDVDSYSDNDSENQGDAKFREDLGVDIVEGGSGKAIGYTASGEWLEYTVEVPEDGDYAIKASASTGMESASFCFLADGKAIGDTITVPQTGEDWSVYKEFEGGKAKLTKGTHVIRLVITGDNVNVDWFSLGDVEKVGIGNAVRFQTNGSREFRVYSVSGKLMGTVDLRGKKAEVALSEAGFTKGVYMLKSIDGRKTFMTSVAR